MGDRESLKMADSRPNILFFFADDQRHDTINALGNCEVVTPNLDKLVARGTAFTQASIMGGTSGAICMPSRAMLMTGRTLFHLDGVGRSIPEEHIMMPEALRAAGYTTFGTGKWHNGRDSFARCFSCGDRVFFGGMSDHFKVPLNKFDDTGEYPEDRIYFEEKRHSSDLFSGAAVDFLTSYDGDDPFFGYISFTAPHDPRDTNPKYHGLYDASSLTLPENYFERHSFDNGDLETRDELLAPFPRTPEIVLEHLAAYYAMITHLDAQVGEVIAAVEARQDADRTIVVFAGDNGLAVGQHGLMGKQNLYEHSIRVPLIFAGPDIPTQTHNAFCYLTDIYSTLFEMAGLSVPESVEGSSLVSALSDPGEPVRDSLLYAYKDFQRSAKKEGHKLIEYAVDGQRTRQLFDLGRDPWETENLIDQPEMSGVVERLESEIVRWNTELGDDTAFWP